MADIIFRSMVAAGDPLALNAPASTCDRAENGHWPGECAANLVAPGWSYLDETRRQYVFQLLGTREHIADRAFLQQIMQFVTGAGDEDQR